MDIIEHIYPAHESPLFDGQNVFAEDISERLDKEEAEHAVTNSIRHDAVAYLVGDPGADAWEMAYDLPPGYEGSYFSKGPRGQARLHYCKGVAA